MWWWHATRADKLLGIPSVLLVPLFKNKNKSNLLQHGKLYKHLFRLEPQIYCRSSIKFMLMYLSTSKLWKKIWGNKQETLIHNHSFAKIKIPLGSYACLRCYKTNKIGPPVFITMPGFTVARVPWPSIQKSDEFHSQRSYCCQDRSIDQMWCKKLANCTPSLINCGVNNQQTALHQWSMHSSPKDTS